MKKQIFSIIIVFCIGLAGIIGTGCKPRLTPSQLPSYKAINDPLITGVANLEGYKDENGNYYDNETYVVWYGAYAYNEAGNYQTNFNFRYWPAANVFPENKAGLPEGIDNYYDVFKKDAAGFYLVLKKGKNTIVPLIKKGRNYWSFFTEAFGSFTCSETDNELLENRIQYCLCVEPEKM